MLLLLLWGLWRRLLLLRLLLLAQPLLFQLILVHIIREIPLRYVE